ncbi:Auxin-responsive protein SAUR76 [Sesamum angolense]|uniref:Auxin-responsive protein SAUR76 n=1 Tax=Sesamum angolense TaxID=2727404 RepID=A0AAE1WNR9_9LAMI|nr:Auxin-responsive protein SAUR76 [Sesamum angolense]
MAKGGKLTKIKSVLKKMQSFKLGRATASASSIAAANSSSDDDSYDPASAAKDLHPVYVGKSRRRYLIRRHGQPALPRARRAALRRRGHRRLWWCGDVRTLLWMLENADPQPESLDELVEFYAC